VTPPAISEIPAIPEIPETPEKPYPEWAESLLSFDLETYKIAPGVLAPPIVCGSSASVSGLPSLLSRKQAHETFLRALLDKKTLIGANIAYDMAVMANERPEFLPEIFRAYEEARVFDVQIAQALDAIAGGHLGIDPRTGAPIADPVTGKKSKRYSLAICTDLVLGRIDAKANDDWRTSYALLDGVTIDRWPHEAAVYPKDDAANTLAVALAQLGLGPGVVPYRNLDALPDQAETAFALQLGAVRGIRTDRHRATRLRAEAEAKRAAMTERYQKLGFLRQDGSQDTIAVKRAVALAYGAAGACPKCVGTGKIQRSVLVDCRGPKVKGRYAGCGRVPECPCGATGKVAQAQESATCKMADGGCDGTGLDVLSAPAVRKITTDKGGISTSRDTLSELGDEDLHDFSASEHDKILDTYLPFLEQGFDRPITLSPNVVLETGRSSYDGVIQLMPSRGGVRECFVPRPGYYFCSVDYAALELCCLAQMCLWVVGWSRMADVINATKDPGLLHTSFGARMIGVPVEQMKAAVEARDLKAKNTRQAAKAGNFSFGGGAGAATTVISNRSKSKGSTKAPDGFEYAGIRFCILLDGAERCGEVKVTEWGKGMDGEPRAIPPTCARCLKVVQEILRPAWFEEYPEMTDYFAWVKAKIRDGATIPCYGRKFWRYSKDTGFVRQSPAPLGKVITRGGVGFTDAANNGFQALAAFGAKLAVRRVVRESYTDRTSALWGTRPLFFAHDEIFSEIPIETAHLAGPRKAEVMREAMREVVPDVHIGAEPALMECWTKDADPAYDASGKLVCWRPKKKG
jgi:hypothetical protein